MHRTILFFMPFAIYNAGKGIGKVWDGSMLNVDGW